MIVKYLSVLVATSVFGLASLSGCAPSTEEVSSENVETEETKTIYVGDLTYASIRVSAENSETLNKIKASVEEN